MPRQSRSSLPLIHAACQDAFHGGRDFFRRNRARGGREIVSHTERKFGFDHAHKEMVRFQTCRAFKAERGQHSAPEWLLHVQQFLRDGIGARDLVADRFAAVMLPQASDQIVLASVGLILGSRACIEGKLAQSSMLESGFRQKPRSRIACQSRRRSHPLILPDAPEAES